MQDNTTKLGWIGMGKIGTPMAENLAKAGFPLTVYNRDKSKTKSFEEKEISVSPNVTALVQSSDVVFTMIANDAAVEEVYGEISKMDSLSGKLFIDMSTISKGLTVRTAEALAAKGASFIDAPVAGSVKPAQEATLIIMCGGKPEDVERARPYLEKMGKLVKHLGPNGSGIAAKLAINYYLSIVYVGLAEAVLFAEKSGVQKEAILELINESATGSGATKVKTPVLLSGDYKPAFTVQQMLKDVKLAQNEGAHFPLSAVLEQTYTNAVGKGLGELDVIGVVEYLKQLGEKHSAVTF
jgi:3-hydroxyisobutyrate dehydrogenase